MEESRTEKLEALETLVSYNDKVVKNVGILIRISSWIVFSMR